MQCFCQAVAGGCRSVYLTVLAEGAVSNCSNRTVMFVLRVCRASLCTVPANLSPFSCGKGNVPNHLCCHSPLLLDKRCCFPVHTSPGMFWYLREAFSGTFTNVTYHGVFAKSRGVCCRSLNPWQCQSGVSNGPSGVALSREWMFWAVDVLNYQGIELWMFWTCQHSPNTLEGHQCMASSSQARQGRILWLWPKLNGDVSLVHECLSILQWNLVALLWSRCSSCKEAVLAQLGGCGDF